VPCLQGLLLRRVARIEESDPRPVVGTVVRALVV
jgi:hypothetical protein